MGEVSKEVCDLHTKHYETTLAQHEETIRQLTECTQKLTHIISTQEEKQRDLDKRLKTIEHRSNVILEKVLIAGLTALVSVIVTILFTGR
jgi:chromosome segregation ATPase